MRNWNVIIKLHEHHFAQVCKFLEAFGQVAKTDFLMC